MLLFVTGLKSDYGSSADNA